MLKPWQSTSTSHGGHVRKVTDVCKNYQFCQHYYEWNNLGSGAIKLMLLDRKALA